jgi:hypothetical protein
MIITLRDVHDHWPDYVTTAHGEVTFCSCGAEFRSSTERTDELWAAHVADELSRLDRKEKA